MAGFFHQLLLLVLSMFDPGHGHSFERLPDCHKPIRIQSFGYSIMKMITADNNGEIKLQLAEKMLITGLEVRTNPSPIHTVSSFNVKYSIDCMKYNSIKNQSNLNVDFIIHNPDETTTIYFTNVFEARCINLETDSGSRAMMKVALLGCGSKSCYDRPLGLGDRSSYPDSSFTGSDDGIDEEHSAKHARIGSPTAWVPKSPNYASLVVKFPSEMLVTGVIVQGDGDRWVKEMVVATSRNCQKFDIIQDKSGPSGKSKIFYLQGPSDGTMKKIIMFPGVYRASCIKVHLTKYTESGAALRLDLIGCGTGNGIAGQCGKSKYWGNNGSRRSKRMVNSDPTVQGEWPWLVSVYYAYAGRHHCGGTLINDKWVVTAAHCFKLIYNGVTSIMLPPSFYHVIVGEHSFRESRGTEYRAKVKRIIIHPEYDSNYDTRKNTSFTHINDIALIELQKPVVLTDYVNTACLTGNEDITTQRNCRVAGWGAVSGASNVSSDISYHSKVKLVDHKTCASQHKLLSETPFNPKNFPSSVVCGKSPNDATPCQGDSGGPLVCYTGDRWTLIGVVSWGERFCSGITPSVYTKVASYLPWIEKEVGLN